MCSRVFCYYLAINISDPLKILIRVKAITEFFEGEAKQNESQPYLLFVLCGGYR